jgi:cytochrome c
MDSFEINKIAGAVLGTLTFAMFTSFGSELLFAEKKTAKAGYELPLPAAATPVAAVAAAAAEPIAIRLASADKGKGEAVFKQCVACHSVDKGGKNGTGPAMWGIVEREQGKAGGYEYSATFKTIAAKGEKWTFDSLDKFVEAPKVYAAGTKMSYGGLSNAKSRADLIAYLTTLSDSPVALPK